MNIVEFKSPGKPLGPRTLFLHGFPAVRSQQNRFYAERSAHELHRDCTIVLYSGLGFAPGVFSFAGTLGDVEKFFLDFTNGRNEKIDIVGHSWGGFMALVLAGKNPGRIGRLVLMSPLLYFAEATRSLASFEETAAGNPHLSLGDHRLLAEDFEKVGRSHPAKELIGKVPESVRITYLQAKDDVITPPSAALSAQPFFKVKPAFELLETDHSFLVNRDTNAARIVEGLKR